MSLRDQLLKAGLINKKQAKQAQAAENRQKHREMKGKADALEARREREEELRAIEDARAEKRADDLRLNLEMEARRKAHEDLCRCRQIIRSQALNERSAEEAYYFVPSGVVVRRVMVTPMQRELLARGRAALCENPDEAGTFLIVGEKAARTIGELCPDLLVCHHPLVSNDQELTEYEGEELVSASVGREPHSGS